MSEQTKTELSCGEYSRGVPWYPLRKWWQPSLARLFNQDAGLTLFLEPWDPRRMDVDGLQRSLAACSWPGYTPAPLFVPYIAASMHHPGQETSKEQYKWRVSLDVAHFAPPEISLSVRAGFLEVRGRHEERPDEHGFIARCFTRKYRLPAEIDATRITSTLSVDAILTVEAPVPESSVPAAIIIPIKVEMEVTGEQQETEEDPDREPAGTAGTPPAEQEGEEFPQELHGDQAQPGSATAGPQLQEERSPGEEEEEEEEEEETQERPAGESHPSEPADGEGSFQDSSQRPVFLEHQESPDTEVEHKEPDVDGDIQVMAGSGEAAEEIAQREDTELGESPPGQVPSQEIEHPIITQQHIA